MQDGRRAKPGFPARFRAVVRARFLEWVEAYDFGERTLAEFCLKRWEDNSGFTARLENCTLTAAGYGLDYRWPLLDVRLIAFLLAVPAEETVEPDGHFGRRAVAGLLPDSVVWKDRSMGILAPMPDSRWSEPVDLRHEALDARLGRLVDPERFGCAMDGAGRAGVRDRQG